MCLFLVSPFFRRPSSWTATNDSWKLALIPTTGKMTVAAAAAAAAAGTVVRAVAIVEMRTVAKAARVAEKVVAGRVVAVVAEIDGTTVVVREEIAPGTAAAAAAAAAAAVEAAAAAAAGRDGATEIVGTRGDRAVSAVYAPKTFQRVVKAQLGLRGATRQGLGWWNDGIVPTRNSNQCELGERS
jgi:hypothetical protein